MHSIALTHNKYIRKTVQDVCMVNCTQHVTIVPCFSFSVATTASNSVYKAQYTAMEKGKRDRGVGEINLQVQIQGKRGRENESIVRKESRALGKE